MILKGSQRGGAVQLANHLMNARDNEHIDVHDINGFIADDVHGALKEMYAVSRATKATQFMFSLSLSPPEDADVSIEAFEDAIEQVAERLGLAGQPRVTLFHEKKARRHCHVVFSRIDTSEMKAINLPFFKERLQEVSRELYLLHEWDLPKGMRDRSLADPRNYSLTEYQEALRAKRDPREVKAALKQCWQESDGSQSFAAALQEKGFYLAKGDRRGFVALDWQGNVYSLSRWLDEKSKALKARLGDPERLPGIEQTREKIAMLMSKKRAQFLAEIEADFERKMAPLKRQQARMLERHRKERSDLRAKQKQRAEKEAFNRSKNLRRGLRGLWDWITGRRAKIFRQNARLVDLKRQQDRAEKLSLITAQRASRKEFLHNQRKLLKSRISAEDNIKNTHKNLYLKIIFYKIATKIYSQNLTNDIEQSH